MTHYIPWDIKLETPKIPFTNIPNPLGTAVVSYGDGKYHLIPLYYVQEGVRTIFHEIYFCYLMWRRKNLQKSYLRRKERGEKK